MQRSDIGKWIYFFFGEISIHCLYLYDPCTQMKQVMNDTHQRLGMTEKKPKKSTVQSSANNLSRLAPAKGLYIFYVYI